MRNKIITTNVHSYEYIMQPEFIETDSHLYAWMKTHWQSDASLRHYFHSLFHEYILRHPYSEIAINAERISDSRSMYGWMILVTKYRSRLIVSGRIAGDEAGPLRSTIVQTWSPSRRAIPRSGRRKWSSSIAFAIVRSAPSVSIEWGKGFRWDVSFI